MVSKLFTGEEVEFIREHHKGIHMKDLLEMLNERFNKSYRLSQLISFCYKNGFKNGLDTRLNGSQGAENRFKGGYISPYKGMALKDREGYTEDSFERMKPTQFKKGNRPHNYRPIGSIRFSADGYYEKKTAEHKWELLQRVIWREAYGEIPKGSVIVFLDGDSRNVKLENLALVDYQVNMKRHKFGKPADTDTGRTIIALSELDMAIDRRSGKKKRVRKKRNGQNKEHAR